MEKRRRGKKVLLLHLRGKGRRECCFCCSNLEDEEKVCRETERETKLKRRSLFLFPLLSLSQQIIEKFLCLESGRVEVDRSIEVDSTQESEKESAMLSPYKKGGQSKVSNGAFFPFPSPWESVRCPQL